MQKSPGCKSPRDVKVPGMQKFPGCMKKGLGCKKPGMQKGRDAKGSGKKSPGCKRAGMQKGRDAKGPGCKRAGMQKGWDAKRPGYKRSGCKSPRDAIGSGCKSLFLFTFYLLCQTKLSQFSIVNISCQFFCLIKNPFSLLYHP